MKSWKQKTKSIFFVLQSKNSARHGQVKREAPPLASTSKSTETGQQHSSKSHDPKRLKFEAIDIGSKRSSKSVDLQDIKLIKVDAIWTGHMNLVDVVTFQVSITPLWGSSLFIEREFPVEMNIAGRIPPDVVMNYIDNAKHTKDIVILQLETQSDDNHEAYNVLHQHLKSNGRYGVIKCKSLVIKDFYVVPLAANKRLPDVYIRDKGANMGIGTFNTDVLLAIIVKNR